MQDNKTGRDTPETLAPRIRTYLQTVPETRLPVTYSVLARDMALAPPQTIHRVAMALEYLMEDDAAAGRPFIAALVISKRGEGMPAAGFFDRAKQLGRFDGDAMGPEAKVFHAGELEAALDYWRS